LFVAKSRSWGMADFLCLKMRLRKNFSTKRGSFVQFLIRIRIQRIQIRDSNPDSNPDPDSKLTAGRIRIRNQIRNFSFGSATLLPMPKSQQSLVQSQNPPTLWNMRGDRWSSIKKTHKKSSVGPPLKSRISKSRKLDENSTSAILKCTGGSLETKALVSDQFPRLRNRSQR
jgi:hypothetical protein